MRAAFYALRSALYVLFLVITVIPFGTAVMVIALFTRGNLVYRTCVAWLDLSIWGAKVICGVHARVHGAENLPETPVVLLSKHQSTWETLAYPGLMPRPLAYVFKRELLYIPFFGWSMARMDMIHIDRSKRAQAWHLVSEQGRRLMDQGHWVIMFPEGTRGPRGGKGTYKNGGTRLAIDAGRPVLPIAVASARCWPRKSFTLRPGVVDISIGRPIESVGRKPDELMHEVEAWIEAEMRRIDPEAYEASPPPARAA